MSLPAVCRLSCLHHLAVAGAASIVSVGVIAGVLTMFDRAGPNEWLRASPDAVELLARCHELPDRAARERCAHDVVAALVQRARGEARLVQHP
ncbi:MAG: hypothetical protein HXY24_01845 [Rubrivivax sp.]|nr:hypothetical protein [Rubrivivax sp.]